MSTMPNSPNPLTPTPENWRSADRAVTSVNEAPSGITSAARFWTNDMGAANARQNNNSDLTNTGFLPIAQRENGMFGGSGGFSFANVGSDIYGSANQGSAPNDVSTARPADGPSLAAASQAAANGELPSVPMWAMMGAMTPLSGADTVNYFMALSQIQNDEFLAQNPQLAAGAAAHQQSDHTSLDDSAYLQRADSESAPSDDFGA